MPFATFPTYLTGECDDWRLTGHLLALFETRARDLDELHILLRVVSPIDHDIGLRVVGCVGHDILVAAIIFSAIAPRTSQSPW
jgi:hypothetical protein